MEITKCRLERCGGRDKLFLLTYRQFEKPIKNVGAKKRIIYLNIKNMSYDENRISDLIDGGLIEKENSIKKTITELQNEYDELGKVMFNLSNEIIRHLHYVYDSKLESFKNFNDFLRDINSYAGNTFGKIMYINYAKNVFNKR